MIPRAYQRILGLMLRVEVPRRRIGGETVFPDWKSEWDSDRERAAAAAVDALETAACLGVCHSRECEYMSGMN